MNATPAGWYTDPTNPLQERLWDGSEWIDRVRVRAPVPAPQPVPVEMPPPQPVQQSVVYSAPPVAETWDNLAADPWSSTAGEVSPPSVRNVVTQTQVDLRSYQRERLIKKLIMLQRLWFGVVLAVFAYGAVEFLSVATKSSLSTETRSAVLGVLALVLFVAWPALAGVAASAARQAGARAPHPALAVLRVVGTVFLAYVLGGVISPDFSADTEVVLLLSNTGGEGIFRYGFALLLFGFFVYTAALAPVVALSKALKDRYPGDPLYRKTKSRGQDAVPTLYESVHIGWGSVLLSALILGMFDVIAAGTFGLPDHFRGFPGIVAGVMFGFLEKTLEFNRPIVQVVDTPTPEARGFWRVRRGVFLIIAASVGMVLLLLLVLFLESVFG